MGDRRELRVGRSVLDAAGERVVERGLLHAEAELLVAAPRFAQALGDLDQPLDDLGACELLQLVAVEDLSTFSLNSFACAWLVRARLRISSLSSFSSSRTWMFGCSVLAGDRVQELVGEDRDLGAVLVGDAEHVDDLAGREPLGHELPDRLLGRRAGLGVGSR